MIERRSPFSSIGGGEGGKSSFRYLGTPLRLGWARMGRLKTGVGRLKRTVARVKYRRTLIKVGTEYCTYVSLITLWPVKCQLASSS